MYSCNIEAFEVVAETFLRLSWMTFNWCW